MFHWCAFSAAAALVNEIMEYNQPKAGSTEAFLPASSSTTHPHLLFSQCLTHLLPLIPTFFFSTRPQISAVLALCGKSVTPTKERLA